MFNRQRNSNKRCTAALVGLLGMAVLLMSAIAGAQGAPPSTRIYNQGDLIYRLIGDIEPTVVPSNNAYFNVGFSRGLSLAQNESLFVVPGQTVYFSHVLTNTGTLDDSFDLVVANLVDDDGDLLDLQIYLDVNSNGEPDVGEPLITQTSSLAPNDMIDLVIAGAVPVGAVEGDQFRVELLATSVSDGGLMAQVEDTATLITSGANVVINKTSSQACEVYVEAGDNLTYDIEFNNVGIDSPDERTYNVDSVDRSGVMVEDDIPYSLILVAGQNPAVSPVQADFLIQRFSDVADDRWISFDNWNGTDAVDKVGILVPAENMQSNQAGAYSFDVQVVGTATTATRFDNRAVIDEDGDGVADFLSNEVCNQTSPDPLPGTVEADIRFTQPRQDIWLAGDEPDFYLDDNFIDSETYRINRDIGLYDLTRDGVYIQVESTSLTPSTYEVLEDGSRQIVVNVQSANTLESTQVALLETFPGSGVYRALRELMLSLESGTSGVCPPSVIDTDGEPGVSIAPDYSTTIDTVLPECVLRTTNDDTLIVTIFDDGIGEILADAAIVDPLGIVFDSITRQPVEGAQVIICAHGATATMFDDGIADDLCGDDAELALDPFRFINDGVNEPLIIEVSDDEGFYQYPFMLPGTYYIDVIPPENYAFPSTRTIDLFPTLEVVEPSYGLNGEDQVDGSESGLFTLDALNDLIVVDIPLDPSRLALTVTGSCEASGQLLQADEQFNYSVTYANTGNLFPVERTISLDGALTQAVLIENDLPYEKILDADQPNSPTPAEASVVVRLFDDANTDNWISLANWDGVDSVQTIAVLISAADFGPGVSGEYTYNVRTAETVTAGTFINQQVEVDYDGDGTPEFAAISGDCEATGPEASIYFKTPAFEITSSSTSTSGNQKLVDDGLAPDFFDDEDFSDIGHYELDDSIGDYDNIIDTVYVELNTTSIQSSYLNDPSNTASVLADGRRQLIVLVESETTGDTIRMAVQETGYATGTYRSIRQLLLSDTLSGNGAFCPEESEHQSDPEYADLPEDVCVLRSVINDDLKVSFDDPGIDSTIEDLAIVDPFGIVFDSQTLIPVEGAMVAIFNEDGSAAIDLISDEVILPQTVGADGAYDYPRLAPGSYYISIQPPVNYVWPSVVPAVDFATSDLQVSDPSYGVDGFNDVANSGVFTIGVGEPIEVLDFPLDPGGDFQLVIEKTASTQAVELGGLVEYNLSLSNVGTGLVSDISMIDDLPYGFKYIENTLRVNGTLVEDPAGAPGPQLTIDAGDLTANDRVLVNYVLQATAGAVDGDGINEAYAQGTGAGETIQSNIDRVQVEIERSGVLSDKAIVFGKVYVDSDCNNLQNDAEWPIAGVKLYMENGTYVITDENGQYSIFGVEPGQHVIKLDNLTLPDGASLKLLDNRHGADAGSRFLDLLDGEYHRADFAIACPTIENADRLLAQLKQRNQNMNGDWMLDQALLFNPEQNDIVISDSALTSGVIGGTGAFDPNERGEILQSVVPVDFNPEGLTDEQLSQHDGYPGPEELSKAVTEESALEGSFLWPQDNRSISGRFVAQVRVGMTPYLYLNGEKVADSQLGEQIVLQSLNAQVLAWYGLKLEPGDNLIEVKASDPFGNLRVLVSDTFYNPGFAQSLQLSSEKDVVPADGGRSVLPMTIRLLDDNDRLARGIEFVTLETTDGLFYEQDIQESVQGHQVRVINGEATVHLRSSERTGEVLVRATSNSLQDELDVQFVASQRSLIVSGILSAGYDLCDISDNGQGPSNTDCEDGDIESRAALFMKGQIRGDYFLTLSYDSEQSDTEELLRDLNPNEYYPIMGDNSVRGYEAQSRSKLYARLELEKNSLTWGDFTTDSSNSYRDLSRVQRTLTGVEGIYDNGQLKVTGFASQVEDARIVVELEGNGTAMLYQIPGGNIVRNSEVVELITIDREASGLVADSESLQRFIDYTIDYVTGDIRFTRSIPTFDENLNPMRIRISYDQETGGEEELVAGVRVNSEVNDQLTVGGSYTLDENEINGYEIAGGFLEYRPNEKSVITLSGATMDHEDDTQQSGGGLYASVEMTWDSGGRTNLTWGRADIGFTNGNGVSTGREDYRFSHQQSIGKQLTLDSEATQGTQLLSGDKSNSYRVSLVYDIAGWDLSLGARHLDQKTSTTNTTGNTVIAGAGRSFEILGMSTKMQAEYERETGNDHRQRWQARIDSQVSSFLNLYGQIEQINSLTGVSELSAADERVTASFGVSTDFLPSTSLYNEYRMRGVQDGRELEAVTGVRGDYSLIEGVKISPSMEIITIKEGDEEDSRAFSIGINDTRKKNSRTNARVEARFDGSRDYYGIDISHVARLNLDWSAFVQEDLRYSQLNIGEDELDSTFTLGLTHRPRLDNTHHSLFMYQWIEERGASTLSDRTVHLLSTHQNWQSNDKWIFSGRVGAKYEELPLLDESFSSLTAVMDGRIIYDLNRRFDLDLHAGVIGTNSFDETRYSFGAGLNYLVNRNLRVGIGYNLVGFDEGDLDPQGYNQNGFYINMQYKFDEELFNWLESDVNREAKNNEN